MIALGCDRVRGRGRVAVWFSGAPVVHPRPGRPTRWKGLGTPDSPTAKTTSGGILRGKGGGAGSGIGCRAANGLHDFHELPTPTPDVAAPS